MIRESQGSAAAEACNYLAVIVASGSLIFGSDAPVKQLQIGGVLAVSTAIGCGLPFFQPPCYV